MSTLTQLIQYWLIKNIGDKPQVIRSASLPKGILVLGVGESEWVDCTVHQQVEQSPWCESVANDVNYEEVMAQEPPKPEYYHNVPVETRREGLPVAESIIGDTEAVVTVPNASPVKDNRMCKATAKSGKPCGMHRKENSDFCIVHQPKGEV